MLVLQTLLFGNLTLKTQKYTKLTEHKQQIGKPLNEYIKKRQSQRTNNEHSATVAIFLICILVLVHTAIIRPQEELPETRNTGDLEYRVQKN